GFREVVFIDAVPGDELTEEEILLSTGLPGRPEDSALGVLATALGHLEILMAAEHQALAMFAVFEDDVVPAGTFQEVGERIEKSLAELPGDADMLYLEACYEDCDMKIRGNIDRLYSQAITKGLLRAYIMNPPAFFQDDVWTSSDAGEGGDKRGGKHRVGGKPLCGQLIEDGIFSRLDRSRTVDFAADPRGGGTLVMPPGGVHSDVPGGGVVEVQYFLQESEGGDHTAMAGTWRPGAPGNLTVLPGSPCDLQLRPGPAVTPKP
ncbi:hypothetical protein T484DRAFT_1977877, partial [Baffinella frigidus]